MHEGACVKVLELRKKVGNSSVKLVYWFKSALFDPAEHCCLLPTGQIVHGTEKSGTTAD